jgi:hypothetical protein
VLLFNLFADSLPAADHPTLPEHRREPLGRCSRALTPPRNTTRQIRLVAAALPCSVPAGPKHVVCGVLCCTFCVAYRTKAFFLLGGCSKAKTDAVLAKFPKLSKVRESARCPAWIRSARTPFSVNLFEVRSGKQRRRAFGTATNLNLLRQTTGCRTPSRAHNTRRASAPRLRARRDLF